MDIRSDTVDIKADIAREALGLVSGPRQRDYGPPEQNFERICRLWNDHMINRGLIPNDRLEPLDVAAFMVLMKLARLAETPDHRDSVVDMAGYALCYAELALQPPPPVDLVRPLDEPDDWVDWPADVEPPQAAE
jgi:hypothetical protein